MFCFIDIIVGFCGVLLLCGLEFFDVVDVLLFLVFWCDFIFCEVLICFVLLLWIFLFFLDNWILILLFGGGFFFLLIDFVFFDFFCVVDGMLVCLVVRVFFLVVIKNKIKWNLELVLI